MRICDDGTFTGNSHCVCALSHLRITKRLTIQFNIRINQWQLLKIIGTYSIVVSFELREKIFRQSIGKSLHKSIEAGAQRVRIPANSLPAHVISGGVDVFASSLAGMVLSKRRMHCRKISSPAQLAAEGLGVAGVLGAEGGGWEAGVNASGPFAGSHVLVDKLADAVPGRCSGTGLGAVETAGR